MQLAKNSVNTEGGSICRVMPSNVGLASSRYLP